ncbi:hypothetical protein [Rufibacter ruber]|uniref:hypothetical protein n=1 Tax=Rufibacter ruber TaxID=1783499 RepID=UPI00129077FC|nr:hypothetical protein [Rufibacter ruber]
MSIRQRAAGALAKLYPLAPPWLKKEVLLWRKRAGNPPASQKNTAKGLAEFKILFYLFLTKLLLNSLKLCNERVLPGLSVSELFFAKQTKTGFCFLRSCFFCERPSI